MCDYSLHTVKSRPARVGDVLLIRHFGTGTRGFAALEDCTTAVCLAPGTELVFSKKVVRDRDGLLWWWRLRMNYTAAIFRKVNTEERCVHHDALEFPDGEIVLLTCLCESQKATVLQVPAQPKIGRDKVTEKLAAYLGRTEWLRGERRPMCLLVPRVGQQRRMPTHPRLHFEILDGFVVLELFRII